MKLLFSALFTIFSSVLFAQTEIKSASELKDHVGDSVKYCGTVATAKMMDRSLNAPTFINLDNAYPNQTLTVVVWAYDRKNFTERPEKFYLNKKVCVYGKLELFKGQLQITIHGEDQIVVQE